MSDEAKVDGGKVGTLVVNESWQEQWKRERDEQEAAFQFIPAEHVAHVKHKTRADWRIECKVKYAGIGKFPWSTVLFEVIVGARRDDLKQGRTGCESSYRAACLAALTVAKELADGE